MPRKKNDPDSAECTDSIDSAAPPATRKRKAAKAATKKTPPKVAKKKAAAKKGERAAAQKGSSSAGKAASPARTATPSRPSPTRSPAVSPPKPAPPAAPPELELPSLAPADMSILDPVEFRRTRAANLLRSLHDQSDAAAVLRSEFGISTSTAYRDLRAVIDRWRSDRQSEEIREQLHEQIAQAAREHYRACMGSARVVRDEDGTELYREPAPNLAAGVRTLDLLARLYRAFDGPAEDATVQKRVQEMLEQCRGLMSGAAFGELVKALDALSRQGDAPR